MVHREPWSINKMHGEDKCFVKLLVMIVTLCQNLTKTYLKRSATQFIIFIVKIIKFYIIILSLTLPPLVLGGHPDSVKCDVLVVPFSHFALWSSGRAVEYIAFTSVHG